MGFIKYQQQLTSMNNILDANNQLPPLADFKEKTPTLKKPLFWSLVNRPIANG
ncbi:MAG: hypothetical protein R3E73_12830 [Porticoccaceae bacterium]